MTMLKLFVHKQEVPVSITKFPAGESLVSIKDEQMLPSDSGYFSDINAMITMKFESNEDIINLLMLTDCIRRYYFVKVNISLKLTYMPYARQDRVCNKGEALSVKVIADLINSQNYDRVYTTDAHSEVTPALLNNCINIPLEICASKLKSLFDPTMTILVSPDAGANKKVFQFAKTNGFPEVVRADKTRDVAPGKITGTKVYHELFLKTKKDFLILDDICDGGYTFIQLAKELRKLTTGKVCLYVTHGLFTKGLEPLVVDIDKIYVSNMFKQGFSYLEKDFVEIL